MASYDFDQPIQRNNTASFKWDIPNMKGVLPMWVADMDFRVAPEIIEAIKSKADHGVFGYALAPDSLVETVVERMKRLYNWDIKPEWLVWLPGLETSFALASSSLGDQGDGVMRLTPIYPPFYTGPRAAHRKAVQCPLRFKDDQWSIDYEVIEAALANDRTIKLLLFCNPHNPIGKVFSREELLELGQFCLDHKLKVCSDEVHGDLIFNDKPHIPFATLSPECEDQSITLMAPSKTFNIAGLGCGFAIIPNAKWRQSFQISMRGNSAMVNNMGYVACEAAYRYGEAWRLELLDYLRSNIQLIDQAMQSSLSELSWLPPEATYLAWLDARSMQVGDPTATFKKHGVGLSPGHIFGSKGWVRLNFATRKALLEEGLSRMAKALKLN
jgi:cystathionine beta-lyase